MTVTMDDLNIVLLSRTCLFEQLIPFANQIQFYTYLSSDTFRDFHDYIAENNAKRFQYEAKTDIFIWILNIRYPFANSEIKCMLQFSKFRRKTI